MMNVRTMDLVVEPTTRGEIPAAVVRICDRWEPDPGTLKYIRCSNTHVFRFERNGKGRFLRLTPASERRRGEVEGELDFILHLARHGVPVAVPQGSESGLLVEDVAVSETPHYAVVFHQLPGTNVDISGEDAAVTREWGRNLDRLHAASRGFVTGPTSTIRSWEDDLQQMEAWLPAKEEVARRALAESAAWLRGLPVNESDHGVIHFDFEEDNLFWDGTVFHVCDFECSARYWYAADVAFALHGMRQKTPEQRRRLLEWFLEGYCESMPLGDECKQWVTGFVKFCVVYHFAKMCAAYQQTDPADDAAWLAAMRRRHEAWFATTRTWLGEPWQW